jgi:hypothetical protein
VLLLGQPHQRLLDRERSARIAAGVGHGRAFYAAFSTLIDSFRSIALSAAPI